MNQLNTIPEDLLVMDVSSTSLSEQGIADLLLNIAGFAVYIAGALAVLYVVFGAVQILISGADSNKTKKGRNTVVMALVGLTLCILSFTIVNVVQTVLTTTRLDF